MPQVYLIQTGQTTWTNDRVESLAGAPLTEQGALDMAAVAGEIAAENKIDIVYTGIGETEHKAAALAAKIFGVKVRANKELHELNFGLWQGLTYEEIKRRHPKVYKQWTEAPASVHPPDGESFAEAYHRLRRAMKGILKRNRDKTVLMVLRPVIAGIMRCVLAGESVDNIRRHSDPQFRWARFEVNQDSFAGI